MNRLLFVPGFTADSYNSIQKRYVALTDRLRGRLDLVWCLPPDDPEEWIWADPSRQREEPAILAELSKIGATVIHQRIHTGSPWRRTKAFHRLLNNERFGGVYAAFAHRFPPLCAGHRAGAVTIWDAAWNSLEPPHRFARSKAVFYRRCIDRFVAATPLIADSLRTHGIADSRIFVRWSGIDTRAMPAADGSSARSKLRKELGISDDASIVLQLTSYLPSKNTLMAVRVLASLANRIPSLHWVFAGEDGPDSPRVLALSAQLGLTQRVHMLGHRQDVWDLLAACDVVALTSKQDGLPNALLEAMAARRPVVTTAASGPEFIVDDGVSGFLVPSEDDAVFAERLSRLLSDAQLRRCMGQRGFERVARDFTLDRWCERLGDFLCSCLDAPAAAADTSRGESPLRATEILPLAR